MSLHQPLSNHNGIQPPDALSDIAYERHPSQPSVPATYTLWKQERPQPHRPTPPSRVTVKWHDGDIEMLFTIEDETDDAVFARLKKLKAAIVKSRQQSRPAGEVPHQPPPDSTVDSEPSCAATETSPPSCPLHGDRYLKPSKYGHGLYCSTKVDGTWCSFKTGGRA
jgi:hypothetical protein